VVTDTGSTKAQVLRWAQEILPATVSFVGGHPLAGKETPGIENADPRLFVGSTYCIVPAPEAAKSAVEAVAGLVNLLEAKPYFVNAMEHDLMVAAVSHLPLLLSAALMSLTAKSPSWSDMAKVASSGFRDATRLAATDPEMSKGILLTNTEGLSHWLDEYITLLLRYRQMLAEGGEALAGELVAAWEARLRWQLDAASPARDPLIAEIPSAGEQMTEFLVGGRLARLFRRESASTQSPPQAGPEPRERKR
jgi:prephenate dehydrogenase